MFEFRSRVTPKWVQSDPKVLPAGQGKARQGTGPGTTRQPVRNEWPQPCLVIMGRETTHLFEKQNHIFLVPKCLGGNREAKSIVLISMPMNAFDSKLRGLHIADSPEAQKSIK